MIATWMATTTIFTIFLALGAIAVERALRTLGKQARLAWVGACAAALLWPLVAAVSSAVLPRPADDGVLVALPTVRSTIGAITATLPPIPTPWIDRLDAMLLALWLGASLLLLARLMLAMRALAAVERSATPEIIAGVPVFLTPTIGPAVFGVRRPRLLVPRWILDLDDALRALVIRHEQEHFRARDPQLTLVVALAVALVPWNVGVWWIARRLRLAMELDCDARVLRVTHDQERYARLLLFIAQRQTRAPAAIMLAESKSDLSRRITEMNVQRPSNPGIRVAVLALFAAVALACSSKYGTDLVTSPPDSRAVAQTEIATYYSPEGATPANLVDSPVLTYPPSLKSARVGGEVLAMFVVDSTGRVLDGSLRIVRSTDSLFTQAVRAAVPNMRLVPAALNGRKVRQLVQQAFIFDPRGTPRTPPPAPRPTTDPTNRNPMPLRTIVVSVP